MADSSTDGGRKNIINDYIAGALGGAAGLVVGHPFDTTKSGGFFRGMGFPLVSYGVVNSVFFGVYGNTLAWLTTDKQGRPSNGSIFLAGCVGGTAQLIVACPVDVVKVVLQSQISHGSKSEAFFSGPRECIRWILRTRGIRGLYTGLASMAWRDSASFGLYVLVYELLFEYLQSSPYTDEHGAVASMLAGGTAGVVTWASVMPFDCIKSRLQADQGGRYRGMVDCIRQTYRQGGYRCFFNGLLINSMRSFPVNAITFLIYSQTLRRLNSVSGTLPNYSGESL